MQYKQKIIYIYIYKNEKTVVFSFSLLFRNYFHGFNEISKTLLFFVFGYLAYKAFFYFSCFFFL